MSGQVVIRDVHNVYGLTGQDLERLDELITMANDLQVWMIIKHLKMVLHDRKMNRTLVNSRE